MHSEIYEICSPAVGGNTIVVGGSWMDGCEKYSSYKYPIDLNSFVKILRYWELCKINNNSFKIKLFLPAKEENRWIDGLRNWDKLIADEQITQNWILNLANQKPFRKSIKGIGKENDGHNYCQWFVNLFCTFLLCIVSIVLIGLK